MSGNEHERWSEDVAAYMLGALEPEEAADFERHAEDCERCRSEMRWLTAAVEVLPEAVERQEPPPELRERLLAEVGADGAGGGRSPAGEDGGAPRSAGAWLSGLGSARATGGRSAGSRRWRWSSSPSAATRSAAATAAAGAGSTETFVAGHATRRHRRSRARRRRGELHLADVGELPPDKVLEAWVQRDGEVEAGQGPVRPRQRRATPRRRSATCTASKR